MEVTVKTVIVPNLKRKRHQVRRLVRAGVQHRQHLLVGVLIVQVGHHTRLRQQRKRAVSHNQEAQRFLKNVMSRNVNMIQSTVFTEMLVHQSDIQERKQELVNQEL